MANLKGSSFDKQIRDANFRLAAYGEPKGDDHKTHSNAQGEKREMYLNDFKQFAEDNGLEGKMNELMTPGNLDKFLEERLEGLQANTIENYASGFKSLLDGLEEQNITIPREDYDFTEKGQELALEAPEIEQEIRGLQGQEEEIFDSLFEKSHELGTLAQLQLEEGFRISEAQEILTNPDKYIKTAPDGSHRLEDVVGKGGHIYSPKEISQDLASKLNNCNEIPSQSTYNRELKEFNVSSHDFRFQYAKNEYERLEPTMPKEEALLTISEELNHHRAEITEYYLSRT